MTGNKLMCAAILVVATTASAFGQVTSSNPEGPTITIDVVRVAGPGSPPAIDPLTGGITYVVGVTPDANQPVFGSGAGPLGPGAAVGVELGLLVGGDGFSNAVPAPTDILPDDAGGLIVVNVDSTPGTGTSETDDGVVEFASPGNPIFGFEDPNLGFGSFPGGVQVGEDPATGQDAIFAALGTTFFTANSLDQAPFELFRVRTAALDLTSPNSLAPSLTLVAGSITAQAIDLFGGAPVAMDFVLPLTASEPFTVGQITGIPEPTTGVLILLAAAASGYRRRRAG